jgi:hypothetical protein
MRRPAIVVIVVIVAVLGLSRAVTVAALASEPEPYYRSTDGSEVHRPTHRPSKSYGHEAAVCRDDTYSYSHHDRGTCAHHGGVTEWE